MRPCVRWLASALMVWASASAAWAGQVPAAGRSVVVFYSPGFPAVETPVPPEAALRRAFAGAQLVDEAALAPRLADPGTSLLVLPYGSAYPEAAWAAMLGYLDRGGNLLVIGGRAFTRAAYRDAAGWHLRAYSTGATLELFVVDYQQTPGSGGLRFRANQDFGAPVPAFAWRRGFSPVVRLSVTERYHRDGSTGDIDARLTPLAWGDRGGDGGSHTLVAPAIAIDHDRQRFVGGRWVLLDCEPMEDFYATQAERLLPRLAAVAVRHGDRFEARPVHPLFLPGEPIAVRYELLHGGAGEEYGADRLRLRVTAGHATPFEETVPAAATIVLPAAAARGDGLHTVEATLVRGGADVATYRSGFWMRDLAYLNSGPRLTVSKDYFLVDGTPLPVVGTTYMSSDVQRLFLMRPNAWVWQQDMAQMRAAGLNMLRSGIWSGWEDMVSADGPMTDDTLRAVEAFLMTARQANLPVQFNLFAFLPDTFGGANAYLDPAAVARQEAYVRSAVERFHAVPYLAWDLINEPSANQRLWQTAPSGDPLEAAAWKRWLQKKYADPAALAAAWSVAASGMGRVLQPQRQNLTPERDPVDLYAEPLGQDFAANGVRAGFNPVRAQDFYLFTQEVFSAWTRDLAGVIRAAGSTQLITVGQEENGVGSRLSPAFYGDALDFTCDHTWWDFDGALWASLAAKLPGKPMLIQETGQQRRVTMDDQLRFSAEVEAKQMERKLAMAFVGGTGAIQWLWNVNAYMGKDDEVTIGSVRPDGTEMPDAAVLSGFARFAEAGRAYFTAIVPAETVLVQSQALQYSALNEFAVAAQKRSLRALAYTDHLPVRMVAENRLGRDLVVDGVAPKLVILPAAQALSEEAWGRLLAYVDAGGTLLVTGPVERDEHWIETSRMRVLGLRATVEPIAVRESAIVADGAAWSVSYPQQTQEASTERLAFADGKSWAVLQHGKGKILWFADPVEFGEGYEAVAAVYRQAATLAGVTAPFTAVHPLAGAVLAMPTMLPEAVLYSFSNESFEEQRVDLVDVASHAPVRFQLPAQSGAMLLLRRSDGAVIASYGVGTP